MRITIALAPTLAAGALALSACGSSGGGSKPAIKVSAASSLKQAFTTYGATFGAARTSFSFAGSDELAAQIKQGAKPDVYAAANTKLPAQLYAAHLVEKPVTFATNTLVVGVPANGAKVRSLGDLAKGGVTIAVGSPSVPIGAYTSKVLAALPAGERTAIEANVRSREPDVAGIVGKVTQGAVDAGFVYLSDVRGSGGRLRAIRLPASVSPAVAYGAAVVKGTAHAEQARAFVDGLVSGAGRDALQAAGFGAPPR